MLQIWTLNNLDDPSAKIEIDIVSIYAYQGSDCRENLITVLKDTIIPEVDKSQKSKVIINGKKENVK